MTLVRELVVRFLLTAIGYRGPYISHLRGLHHASFLQLIEPNEFTD
jgi:hypothetical protein